MADTLQGQRIMALSVLVPDYESGIDFFGGKLGFDLLEDTDMGGGQRWVRVRPKGGGVELLLARAATDEQRAAIGNQSGGRVFLFLETDDLDRDHTAYLAAGVTFLEAPRSEPYGKVAVMQDPFGNKWDLIEPVANGSSFDFAQHEPHFFWQGL
jgi:catechol 2,3-dioxygenase-like lactoylglutathione lyase family enzyme